MERQHPTGKINDARGANLKEVLPFSELLTISPNSVIANPPSQSIPGSNSAPASLLNLPLGSILQSASSFLRHTTRVRWASSFRPSTVTACSSFLINPY
jgi:hypothetical protein